MAERAIDTATDVSRTITEVSEAVSESVITFAVQQVMPPVPESFSSVERYLMQNGFSGC